MLRELLSLLFLVTFLLINIGMTFMRVFRSLTGMAWRKVLRLDIPENEKKNLEKLYTVVWLMVGGWALVKLWGWSATRITAALFGFLAFRSGANVTKTLIYSLHDRRTIEEYTGDSNVLEIIGTATKLSLLLETVFVVAFTLAYKALSVTINTTGTRANTFIIYLWLLGLVFGLLFGWFIAKNNRGILLRNAITTVWFFTARTGKKKAEKTVKKAKKAPEKLRPKPPKLSK
jgi:hypothetical protein